jgi:type IV secretory pathway TraG/TraD family ATPase VirD4
MAESRPYRVINASAQTRLTQIKLIAVSSFLLMALLINWRVTQLVAGLFGYGRPLGPAWFGFYAPWEWMVWWSRWHWVDRFQPIWEFSIREAAYPLLAVSAATAGVIVIARYFLSGTSSDLHGSAHWAATRDVRSAGLIAPRTLIAG